MMKKIVFYALTIIIFVLFSSIIFGQCIPSSLNTSISTTNTVINTYYPAEQNAPSGSSSINIGAKRGGDDIIDGDVLMVIQMQGAELNATIPDDQIDITGTDGDYADGDGNNDRKGFLTNANYIAGQYEFVIANGSVSAGVINLITPLVNSYEHNLIPTSTIGARTFQVVRVANYNDLTLDPSASIIALPWNGRSGGIVAIDVNNNFTLNGTVSADSLGFRGGGRYASEAVSGRPGYRGEGIAGTPRLVFDGTSISDLGSTTYPGTNSGNFGPDLGPGAPGNAGGAGYSDGGGAGGANGGGGGMGSQDDNGPARRVSVGALAMNIEGGNRLFLGGGGGSGGREDDGQDSDQASSGQPGGGIVIIRANQITGTGTVSANGKDGGSQNFEGAGGGGAGGTILLYTSSGDLSGLNLSATGGNGGNVSQGRDGGGGGGGGGFALLTRIGGVSFSNLPSLQTDGGNPGTSGPNTTAASGGSGGFFTGSLPGDAFECNISVLPITLIKFQASKIDEYQALIEWETVLEINNAYFELERSSDGINFVKIAQIDGAGTTQRIQRYQYVDQDLLPGFNYYRLKQVDFDAAFTYSNIIWVNNILTLNFEIFPNPAREYIYLKPTKSISSYSVRVLSINGQELFSRKLENTLENNTKIDLNGLPSGMYFIEIKTENQLIRKKIMLQSSN